MHLSPAILGQDTVRKLNERQTSAVLIIGSDQFTRPQLSKLGCFNFLAAARLTQLLTELKVKNTEDLFFNFGPGHLALPGLGAICLATIGAAFEAKRVGNLSTYINRHTQKGQHIVTFATFKNNVLDKQAEREEKRRAKNRQHSRLDKATKIRGDRHIARNSKLSLAS